MRDTYRNEAELLFDGWEIIGREDWKPGVVRVSSRKRDTVPALFRQDYFEAPSSSPSPAHGGTSAMGCYPSYDKIAHERDALQTALDDLRARLAALTRENAALQESLDASRDTCASLTMDLADELARAEKARGDAVEHQRLSAKLYVALELSRCECGVSVQPPRAMKCARCAALEDADKLRALAHDEGRGTK